MIPVPVPVPVMETYRANLGFVRPDMSPCRQGVWQRVKECA